MANDKEVTASNGDKIKVTKGIKDIKTLNDTSNTLQLGDKKTLYYDIFEPTSVSDKRGGYEGYIALVLGAIVVLRTGPKFYRIIRDNYLVG